MPTDDKVPADAMHFRSLSLENVRAFGSQQSMQFAGENGAISRWNLILGENGVGKTTLMQALAVMKPVPAYEKPDDPAPTIFMPQLSEHEKDDDIAHFIRRGGPGKAIMMATLSANGGQEVKVGVTIIGSVQLDDVEWTHAPLIQNSGGPLIIGYGAGRHVGKDNLKDVDDRDATESLFGPAIDLYDAELIILDLHYGALTDPDPKNGRNARRLQALKSVVASLLPAGLTADDIEVRGPRRTAVRDPDQPGGVHVRTQSGFTSLTDLSLGYQTMFALTVDLAWRLFNAFPNSTDPLSESAIVLIDEVDLHMHPQWQRDLRRHMLAHFPRVQFIVTSHSPITAQETVSAIAEGGSTIAVVHWVDGEAHILENPIPRGEWRSDQLLESELFGFEADRSKEAEAKIYERIALSRNPARSADQEARLRELDAFVAALPTAPSPNIQSFEELMMDIAKDYPKSLVP
jgi:hypothetical protein